MKKTGSKLFTLKVLSKIYDIEEGRSRKPGEKIEVNDKRMNDIVNALGDKTEVYFEVLSITKG